MTPEVWRVSAVSTGTERLSWMELPLHGIPAGLTVVLAEDGVPTYLAKNLFDLGSLILADRMRSATTWPSRSPASSWRK